MKKFLLLPFLIPFLFSSCDNDEKAILEKEIKFSFSTTATEASSGGRIKDLPEPTALIVTIKDGSGATVADRKELTLYKFGETFLSAPLTLKTSEGANYVLTEFFVLDATNQVVYVTPKEGSEMEHLVADALDINFAVSKDNITTVTPEVLALDNTVDPENYGYGQFGFTIVKSISTVFSAFIKGANNFELTESHLKIEGLAVSTSSDTTVLWTHEVDLAAKANKIRTREAAAYKITATKAQYQNWKSTRILKEGDRIEILFEKSGGLNDKQMPALITFTDKTTQSNLIVEHKITSDQYLRVTHIESKIPAISHQLNTASTFTLPNLTPTSISRRTGNYTENMNILQENNKVTAIIINAPGKNYDIFTTTSENGLITKAVVKNRDYPSSICQVHHFYYDNNSNLTKSKVYLNGEGYEDGVHKIYEQSFLYDTNENAIPSALLESWVRGVLFGSVYATFDYFIVPFWVKKPNNSIISTTYSRFDYNNPGLLMSTEKVNFNYTYQMGKPSSLTIHNETFNREVRSNFTFRY